MSKIRLYQNGKELDYPSYCPAACEDWIMKNGSVINDSLIEFDHITEDWGKIHSAYIDGVGKLTLDKSVVVTKGCKLIFKPGDLEITFD